MRSGIRLFFIWAMAGISAVSGATVNPTPSSTPTGASATWPVPEMSYFVNRLPVPPRPGSFRDRMDVSDVIARQKSVTPKNEVSIQASYLFDVFYFSNVFGPNFNAKNFPKTAAFFSKLILTANGIVGELKTNYKRPRPFAAHPEKIQLLVKNEPGYSYPSGHTTRSRLSAFVMAELAPQYRNQIFKSAELVATDRILAGEHYITDLECGRTLGKMLFAILCENPDFQAEVLALKAAEWTPPPTPINPPKP